MRKMCYLYKGLTGDFPCRSPTYLSKKSLTLCSETWHSLAKNGAAKLSTRKEGFPNLISVDFIYR